MAWTAVNPVTIGNATKKSDYDAAFDNTTYNKTQHELEHSTAGKHKILSLDGVRYATTVGGTANAITLNFTPAVPSLYAGLRIIFLTSSAPTDPTTITVEALAATPLRKNGNIDIVAGDIKVGQIVEAVYDGTNFQLISPMGSIQPQVAAKTGDDTLTAAECYGNYYYTNTGAGGAVNLDLPASVIGMRIAAKITVAQYLKMTLAGTETLRYTSTQYTGTGVYIRENTIGYGWDLACVTTGEWLVVNLQGTAKVNE